MRSVRARHVKTKVFVRCSGCIEGAEGDLSLASLQKLNQAFQLMMLDQLNHHMQKIEPHLNLTLDKKLTKNGSYT